MPGVQLSTTEQGLSLPKVRNSYNWTESAKEFAAILLSPPCSSFSRATWANFRAAATSTPLVAAKPQADSGLARAAGDPDRDFLGQGEEGLPVGILDPLPRTPHIFEDQLKWHLENAPWEASLAASLGTQLRLGGGTPGHREFFKAKFDEDVEEGLMAKVSLGEFQERCGESSWRMRLTTRCALSTTLRTESGSTAGSGVVISAPPEHAKRSTC